MDEHHRTDRQQRITKRTWIWVVCLLLTVLLAAVLWGQRSKRSSASSIPEMLTPYMTYEVVNAYPHDPAAFTQGLIYHASYLYESTGLYGESSLRKVALETGTILQQVDLPPQYFGEGLTLWEDTLLQLTWREGTGFIYDLDDFSLSGQFTYPTEGWGLTHDGERLIMSDGSQRLYFLTRRTFQVSGQVEVSYQGEAIEP
jgi:glutaminyl-peptide cyclotransferase